MALLLCNHRNPAMQRAERCSDSAAVVQPTCIGAAGACGRATARSARSATAFQAAYSCPHCRCTAQRLPLPLPSALPNQAPRPPAAPLKQVQPRPEVADLPLVRDAVVACRVLAQPPARALRRAGRGWGPVRCAAQRRRCRSLQSIQVQWHTPAARLLTQPFCTPRCRGPANQSTEPARPAAQGLEFMLLSPASAGG